MRVGEKETSEQAEIVARYADLFTREQHEALRDEEEAALDDERERLYRLREACLGGIVVARARRASRTGSRTRSSPRGSSSAASRCRFARRRRARDARRLRGARRARRPGRGRLRRASTTTGSSCSRRGEALDAELSGRPGPGRGAATSARRSTCTRSPRRSPRPRREQDESFGAAARNAGSTASSARSARPSRPPTTSPICAGSRRSRTLYTKERAVPVCLETLTRLGFDLAADEHIRLDLDDRPQKNPRACVIASDPPNGRPPDHARAGRAPRLPGPPPRGGARAPLRGVRPGALRTRSGASRATTR